MAELNDIVDSTLHVRGALRVACSVMPKRRSGPRRGENQVKIYLTPPTKLAPPQSQRRLVQANPSLLPAAPASAWVLRVQEGLKRSAEAASLNHRPRKENQQAAASAQAAAPGRLVSGPPAPVSGPVRPPAVKPVSPATATARGNGPLIGAAPPAPEWEKRMAAMEARFATFETELAKRLQVSVEDMISKALDQFACQLERLMGARQTAALDLAVGSVVSRVVLAQPMSASLQHTVPTRVTDFRQQKTTASSPMEEEATMTCVTADLGSVISPHPFASASPAINGLVGLNG